MTIKSMDEFYKKYLPEDYKKYPITMRVSEEEQKLIYARRGMPLPDKESSK